jgi:hypothetical protein
MLTTINRTRLAKLGVPDLEVHRFELRELVSQARAQDLVARERA